MVNEEVFLNGERIFLKKNKYFGWGVVHPVKVDGVINWKNLLAGGSWIKLFFVAFFVLLLVGAMIEYKTAVTVANECINRLNLLRGPLWV